MMNETSLEHCSTNGTTFTAERSDLATGVKVTRSLELSDNEFCGDVAEFAAWHTHCIFPQLNGFGGWGCVRFEVARAKPDGVDLDSLIDECRALKRSNQGVEAVKLYRSRVGCGLREAHDAVMAL